MSEFHCTRGRAMPGGTLFVPTVVTADGSRHIIPRRDGAPLCGSESPRGEQLAPASHRPDQLCLRCRQRHARAALQREEPTP